MYWYNVIGSRYIPPEFQINQVIVRVSNPCEPEAQASDCYKHSLTSVFCTLVPPGGSKLLFIRGSQSKKVGVKEQEVLMVHFEEEAQSEVQRKIAYCCLRYWRRHHSKYEQQLKNTPENCRHVKTYSNEKWLICLTWSCSCYEKTHMHAVTIIRIFLVYHLHQKLQVTCAVSNKEIKLVAFCLK